MRYNEPRGRSWPGGGSLSFIGVRRRDGYCRKILPGAARGGGPYDISFDQAGQWAEEIAQVAGLLAKLDEFEKDESALRFFRQLGERSKGIERLAKAQKWEGMMAALSRLQENCMACHRKHRN